MKRHRLEYRFVPDDLGSERHQWTVVGPRAAIHLHISRYKSLAASGSAPTEWSGGVETHRRSPASYQRDEAPSHDECFLLHQPCWHDGTSTWATEYWIPLWLSNPHDHAGILRSLSAHLDRVMAEDEEAEAERVSAIEAEQTEKESK